MKNLVALSLLLSIAVVSCKKDKTLQTDSTTINTEIVAEAQSFTIDSVRIKDSLKRDKNLTLGFESNLLVFPSLKDKTLLDSIYAPKQIQLTDYSKANLTEALNKKKAEYYEEQKVSLKDYTPEFAQNWFNNSDMKVFSKDNEFLTIQYTGDGYTGGAHGYYYENYKVFDLKNNKSVQLSDIVSDTNSSLWQPILMDNFLKNDSEKGQAEMILVKDIPLNNNFYFDKEFLYFLYNQYEITAYAAGTVLIKIPLSDIKPMLTEEFIQRQGL